MTSRRLTVWIIPVLMVVVALAHGWRVVEFGESPWIGAGFGMFAEIDGPRRVTQVQTVDGDVLTVPSLSSEELRRLSNFPSPRALESFLDRHDQLSGVTILKPVFRDDGTVTWERIASHDDT